MEIRWLGQSAFEIKTSTGTMITDPFPGLFEAATSRDPNTVVAFCKKGACVSGVPDEEKVIDRPGEYEFGGMSVRGVGIPAGDAATSRAVNTMFLLDAEGLTVGVLGLASIPPDGPTQQVMGPVDVLLIRTDSRAMTMDQIAAAVRAIDPKVVVPTGYESSSGAPGPALASFLKQMGVKTSEVQPKLSISKGNLPQDLKVAVLKA